ncbi:multidrug DMT transporter permease [Francisella adeliensis]|uniref:Multidrug DMT transporter permease n=1 Tax=Francisella adeliensis TaxID=2007306 RepID=A0A2Z4Y113_9GAMM|nr:multidrug DMT transporter permease [Francisella adeliensis]AXA34606.1 multidrug DMT transporter permease [Francisella adeliensis]MBK2086331.1 multidrug DMT transporter permease [Francisella adeliensis]MBK2096546.1 multidrug DMT transporter permease [Francisella adeliensis]QIW12850.1 multidrug DMT transporter permease [Francisella adeliensis]QIW14727.1 multidrug DMT transporter permease [Francisella adeliensis]
MVAIHSYGVAVFLCIITMLCWGSWANTQKLSKKEWSFQLFYWDYAIGILIISFVLAITAGNFGSEGRSFFSDICLASGESFFYAFAGGVVFNLANILLVAAIDIAGMSVAFPLAIGLALVIGVIVNYIAQPLGQPILLSLGVLSVLIAIVIDAIIYKRISNNKNNKVIKGILVSVISGILMGFFYPLVIHAISIDFSNPTPSLMTPYTASFIFALGIFLSNFIFNSWMIKFPISGKKLNFSDYFKQGNLWLHTIGILGGVIWGLGSCLNFIASGVAGPSISYGLGQGATMIAAFWGVFIWKEFALAPKGTNKFITLMFITYIIGLILIVLARNI